MNRNSPINSTLVIFCSTATSVRCEYDDFNLQTMPFWFSTFSSFTQGLFKLEWQTDANITERSQFYYLKTIHVAFTL